LVFAQKQGAPVPASRLALRPKRFNHSILRFYLRFHWDVL
jgi:hypothetical protein